MESAYKPHGLFPNPLKFRKGIGRNRRKAILASGSIICNALFMPMSPRRKSNNSEDMTPSGASDAPAESKYEEIRAEWQKVRVAPSAVHNPYGVMAKAAQSYPCAKCGAAPEAKCVSPSGKPLYDPHSTRRKMVNP